MLDRLVAVGMGRSTARRLLSQAARAKGLFRFSCVLGVGESVGHDGWL